MTCVLLGAEEPGGLGGCVPHKAAPPVIGAIEIEVMVKAMLAVEMIHIRAVTDFPPGAVRQINGFCLTFFRNNEDFYSLSLRHRAYDGKRKESVMAEEQRYTEKDFGDILSLGRTVWEMIKQLSKDVLCLSVILTVLGKKIKITVELQDADADTKPA